MTVRFAVAVVVLAAVVLAAQTAHAQGFGAEVRLTDSPTEPRLFVEPPADPVTMIAFEVMADLAAGVPELHVRMERAGVQDHRSINSVMLDWLDNGNEWRTVAEGAYLEDEVELLLIAREGFQFGREWTTFRIRYVLTPDAPIGPFSLAVTEVSMPGVDGAGEWVVAEGTPLPGPEHQMVGEAVLVTAYPVEVPDRDVQPGQTDVTMAAFSLTATAEGMYVETIRLEATAGDPDHIAQLRVGIDHNEDGLLDEAGADELLSTGVYLSDGACELVAGLPLDGDVPVRLVIELDLATDAAELEQIGFAVTAMTEAGEHPVFGLPLDSARHTVRTLREPVLYLSLVGDREQRRVERGAEAAVLAVVRADAAGGDLVLQRLVLSASGTGDDVVDVTDLMLVADRNDDGVVDGLGEPGGDELLAMTTWSGNDGDAVFTMATPLARGSRLQLLITCTLRESVLAGRTFAARVTVALAGMAEVRGLPLIPSAVVVGSESGGDDEFEDGPDAGLTVTSGASGCGVTPGGRSAVWLIAPIVAGLVRRRL